MKTLAKIQTKMSAKRNAHGDSRLSIHDSYERGLQLLSDYLAFCPTESVASVTCKEPSVAKGAPLRCLLEQRAASTHCEWRSLKCDLNLAIAVETITCNCGDRWREVLLGGRLSPKVLRELSGKHPDRQRFAVASAANGGSANAKPKIGLPTYETVGWHEIPSRLSRAEGQLRKAAKTVARSLRQHPALDHLNEELQRCGDLASQVAKLLPRVRPGLHVPEPTSRPSPRSATKRRRKQNGRKQTLKQMVGSARGLLEKNLRDLPRLAREHGVDDDHAGEALRCLTHIERHVDAALSHLGKRRIHSASSSPLPADRRVATHLAPDVDAIVACWLAERFLFAGEPVEIVFVPRDFEVSDPCPYDCVVDVGRRCEPDRLIFDHNPPGLLGRHSTCATRLVLNHLVASSRPVERLADLVQVVCDGDSSRRRPGSRVYKESLRDGLHAEFTRLREGSTDSMLYVAMRAWLDRSHLTARSSTLACSRRGP